MDVTDTHYALPDTAATRRYFAKFERIIGYLRGVASSLSDSQGAIDLAQVDVLEGYLLALTNTFTALSYKHLMTHHLPHALPQQLEIDRSDSGFPVFREFLNIANDLIQLDKHLEQLPDRDTLRAEMVDHILMDRTSPRQLQIAMSQRVYYELLRDKPMFLSQNHPQAMWLGNISPQRRQYLIHWAVYDSQTNLPVIYMMVLEDTGAVASLTQDEKRWPQVQMHLMAQSLSSLKLVTIAMGLDKDFEDLHPKMLRRIHVGPMYSHAFTQQHGPLREVLEEAAGEAGLDWALTWMTETLVSAKTEQRSTGVFGKADKEIYEIDLYSRDEKENGASRVDRSLILPFRPYQVLAHRDPPDLRGVRKFVVGEDGALLVGT